MADEPVEAAKTAEEAKTPEQTIPLKDFVTFKKASEGRQKKLEEQLAQSTSKMAELEVDLDVARKTGGNDEEVKEVQNFLIEERKKVARLEAIAEQNRIALEKRERTIRAKELATEFGIKIQDLEDAEDLDSKALSLYADRLAKENEALKKKVSNSGTYETGAASAVTKKPIADMTPKELDEYGKREVLKTLKKRGY